MSELVRAFLAFEINEESVKKRLANMQAQAVKIGADLKLVAPENIHITIRFLGEITLNMSEKIFEEMQKVSFKPFPVQLIGLGVFPSMHYPRVLWAGIAQGADQLQNIVNQIEPRLHSLGYAPEPTPFSPHLTIARVRSAQNKPELIDFVTKNSKYDFGVVNAQCLRLKRSELTPNGPIYSTLKEYCPR